MYLLAIFIAVLVLLPVLGLVPWARLPMVQVEGDLRSFSGPAGVGATGGTPAAQSI